MNTLFTGFLQQAKPVCLCFIWDTLTCVRFWLLQKQFLEVEDHIFVFLRLPQLLARCQQILFSNNASFNADFTDDFLFGSCPCSLFHAFTLFCLHQENLFVSDWPVLFFSLLWA